MSKKLARESSKIFNSKSFHFYFFGRLFFWNEFWAFFWTTPLGDVFWTPENFLDGGFWTAFFLESTFLGDPCGRTRKKLHDLLGGFWKSNLIHLPPPLNCHLPDPPREDLVQFFSTSVSRNRFANTLVKTVHNKTESTQMRLLLELLSALWTVASLFRENIQNSTPDERRPQFNCVSFKPSHSKSPN